MDALASVYTTMAAGIASEVGGLTGGFLQVLTPAFGVVMGSIVLSVMAKLVLSWVGAAGGGMGWRGGMYPDPHHKGGWALWWADSTRDWEHWEPQDFETTADYLEGGHDLDDQRQLRPDGRRWDARDMRPASGTLDPDEWVSEN